MLFAPIQILVHETANVRERRSPSRRPAAHPQRRGGAELMTRGKGVARASLIVNATFDRICQSVILPIAAYSCSGVSAVRGAHERFFPQIRRRQKGHGSAD
jgi:hypothetical protein